MISSYCVSSLLDILKGIITECVREHEQSQAIISSPMFYVRKCINIYFDPSISHGLPDTSISRRDYVKRWITACVNNDLHETYQDCISCSEEQVEAYIVKILLDSNDESHPHLRETLWDHALAQMTSYIRG